MTKLEWANPKIIDMFTEEKYKPKDGKFDEKAFFEELDRTNPTLLRLKFEKNQKKK